jgi:hypothetical protein
MPRHNISKHLSKGKEMLDSVMMIDKHSTMYAPPFHHRHILWEDICHIKILFKFRQSWLRWISQSVVVTTIRISGVHIICTKQTLGLMLLLWRLCGDVPVRVLVQHFVPLLELEQQI